VEFASRRLEEMVELAANVSSSDRVQLAADRFKNEVASIQVELMASSDTAQFAKSLGRKVDIYSSTVASTSDDLPKEVLGEVEEILEETKEQVVEVIITAHESEQDPETAHELDDALAQEIETVFATYGVAASEAMATAEALRAEGLYRRAFQVLKDFTFELELQNE
jgi:predicted phage gp36 major capsid-like protein